MGVVVGGTYFNTESGLTPLLDRLTATVDTNAQNRAVQGALARSSSAGLTPADDPGPSFLTRMINMVTGQPQPTAPSPAMSAPPPASPVPPSPTVGQSAPATISPNAQTALNFFQAKGLSPMAAAGLVGGFSNESTPKLDPNSVARGDGADGSNSVGIGNWNGQRAQALQQFAAANRMDPSDIRTQLEFTWSELNGPERATLAKLQSATNPLQATVAALGYERPAGWTPDNPLGTGTFGARLASTVGLTGAASQAQAYAPSQGDPNATPAGRAIAAATPQSSQPISAASQGAGMPPQAPGSSPQQMATAGAPPPILPVATASPSTPGPAAMSPQPGSNAPLQPTLADIRQLVLEPQTRAYGLQLWQQMLTAKRFDFQMTPDGTIVRQDSRSGIVTPAYQAPIKGVDVGPGHGLKNPITGAWLGVPMPPEQKFETVNGHVVAGNPSAGTAVDVTPPTVPATSDLKGVEAVDNNIIGKLGTTQTQAQAALRTIDAINRQQTALDKGVYTGGGADQRLKLAQAASGLLGIPFPGVEHTQEFIAAANSKAAELAKQLSQSGHTTNADLNMGKIIGGADINYSLNALRQIGQAQQQLALDTINRHNASVDQAASLVPALSPRSSFYKVATPAPNQMYNFAAAGALAKARDAIQRGAPRDAVIQRLQGAGIDPGSL